jgi:plasmid stabilization system protein ParE
VRPLVTRSVAQTDPAEAIQWHAERSADTAGRFLLAINETVRQIQAHPEIYPMVREPLRRARVPRFPFGIYYRVYPDFISIVGIIHSRRAPEAWQQRDACAA